MTGIFWEFVWSCLILSPPQSPPPDERQSEPQYPRAARTPASQGIEFGALIAAAAEPARSMHHTAAAIFVMAGHRSDGCRPVFQYPANADSGGDGRASSPYPAFACILTNLSSYNPPFQQVAHDTKYKVARACSSSMTEQQL